MSNKDLRRFAIGKWRKNWPTMLVAVLLQFSMYIAVVVCFSFVFSPFLASVMMSQMEGLRRGIGLTVSGIMLALFLFVLLIYLLVSSFSFIYMALKLVRGEKISPFDVFYTLHPKNFPMQIQILLYCFFYAFLPWVFSILFYIVFKPADPVLNLVEELIFNLIISLFLLFFLCTPFLILEKKSKTLGEAMKKSVQMMKHEKHRFLRQLLYFMGIRVTMNILASMWTFSLNDSVLPGILLAIFLFFYLTPYFILVQAGFYQQILNKEKKEAETARAFVASFSAGEKEVQIQKEAQMQKETEQLELNTQSEEFEQTEDAKQLEQTEDGKQTEDSTDFVESVSSGKEEKEEEEEEEENQEKLSFEEARKRYTDYKEES